MLFSEKKPLLSLAEFMELFVVILLEAKAEVVVAFPANASAAWSASAAQS